MFNWLDKCRLHCWHVTERRWKIIFKSRCKILQEYTNRSYKYEMKCCICSKTKICNGQDVDYKRLKSYPIWKG